MDRGQKRAYPFQRQSHARNPAAAPPWPIGYKFLERIVNEQNPEEIVINLSGKKRAQMEERLRGNLDGGMIKMLLKAFSKISESTGAPLCKTSILQLILQYNFLRRTSEFLHELSVNASDHDQQELLVHVNYLLKVSYAMLIVLPNDSQVKVTFAMLILGDIISGLELDETAETQEKYTQVNGILKELKKKGHILKKRGSDALDVMHSQPPPDNFRHIPVLPRRDDILGNARPFIRSNLIDRAYISVDHYLDVHFRLLREDFVRPLRDGIAEIIQIRDDANAKKPKVKRQVKVYEEVRLISVKPGPRGVMYAIQFSVRNLRHVRWHNTKRFLQGNLLCLSSDYFENEVLFAVITEQNPSDLEVGCLVVQFLDNTGEAGGNGEIVLDRPTIDINRVYTMVESESFFESHRHVLSALKQSWSIPLEKYIVFFSGEMEPPSYLKPADEEKNILYDFTSVFFSRNTPLMRAQSRASDRRAAGAIVNRVFGMRPATDLRERATFHPSLLLTGLRPRGIVVDVLHGDWPLAAEMGLDESQAHAVKSALTSELALIQGPPGTGKTHVGLMIMQILIQNKIRWSGNDRQHHPILVVCYTNHALDQFLEGIAKYSSSIVRLGGRCKNDKTKQFSIRELGKLRHTAARSTSWDLRVNLNLLVFRHRVDFFKLESSSECFLTLREMQEFIPEYIYEQFFRFMPRGANPVYWSAKWSFRSWLGFDEEDGLSELSTSVLSKVGYASDEIAQAYEATKYSQDIEMLRDWIDCKRRESQENQKEQLRAQHIAEQSQLIQEQRMLDTDELTGIDSSTGEVGTRWKRGRGGADISSRRGEPALSARQKRERCTIKLELSKDTIMEEQGEARVRDVHLMPKWGAWMLYRCWLKRWRDKIKIQLDKKIDDFGRLAQQLKEVNRHADSEIIQNADVIAATTTGAAKYRDLIYNLNCKIVVVEEAAEVLEAHIVTAMPRATQHLILIGDHQQLKPSPTVYDLAKRHNLDTSLFERLTHAVPYVTLSHQHRMRPEIADLLRPHIYKNLKDHQSVLNRDKVKGIEKSLFFVSHNIPEEGFGDGKSKMNQHEADFLAKLCDYILAQDYRQEQITILVMYTGQFQAFRKMRERHPNIRITTVDNFQGEESDIILMSLVRSNEEAKIGFLGTENRICVALSRARVALYGIGDMKLLASKSSMWRKIVTHLKEKGSIGEALMLQCEHHPDRLSPVKCAHDFLKVPEGGCGLLCETRLDCGHVCPRPCHPGDHSEYKCQKLCAETLPCGHKCKKLCWRDCDPCFEKVIKVLACGHEQLMSCSTTPKEFECEEEVTVTLPCDHQLSIMCGKSSNLKLSMCKERCRTQLECGHSCIGSCYECFQGRLHNPCMKRCNRTLVCGHTCNSSCSSCPPCKEDCQTKCQHSRCKQPCGEPCKHCREKCSWRCRHFKCGKLCGEPCDRPRCNKPCTRLIPKCRHPCIGLCGEPCPKFCRRCDKDEVTEIFFGDEDEKDARFVQLEDCGHIFTYEKLDHWMDQDEDGNAIKMKECPRCKTTIWRSTRYSSVVNKLIGSLNEVKEKMKGDLYDTRERGKVLMEEMRKEVWKMEPPYDHLTEDMVKRLQQTPPAFEVVLLEVKFRRLQQLRELTDALRKGSSLFPIHRYRAIVEDLAQIRKWVCYSRIQATEQEERSFRRELERIKQALKFADMERKYEVIDTERQKLVEPMKDRLQKLLLESLDPYHEERASEVKDIFSRLSKKAPDIMPTLAISETEKKMICKAMGFARKGHWYKCPKGHIYAIGECGGAQQESVCPECQEAIGGQQHRLLSTNRVATEMDGATQSAYDDDAANNHIPRALVDRLRRGGFDVAGADQI